MSDEIQVHVPDIGDFKNVPIIDVLVKSGDVVKIDDPLVTIESDKSSMDVPSPVAGVVGNVQVKIGDKVSQGSAILTLIDAKAVSMNGARNGTASNGVRTERGRHEAPESSPAIDATAAQPPVEAPSTMELRVGDLGEFKDVPVIEVLIKAGDSITADTPVITIESDKASMDVPAGVGGVVQSVALKVGDHVSQGSLIGLLAGLTSAPSPIAPSTPTPTPPVKAPEVASSVQARPAEPTVITNQSVHASPAVRRLAREFGIALHEVQGTASHGRIKKEDLQNYVKRVLQAPGAIAAPQSSNSDSGLHLLPWPKVDFAKFGPVEVRPLSRVKKISGPNLHRNWVMIPHVTNNEEADITELEAFRQQVNGEQGKSGVKLTMLAFLMKAAVCALQKFPDFNASLDGDDLVLKQYYHIGFAADTPNGLMVPIVRDADKKGVLAIAQETRDLAAKARDGKVTAAEMQGGTFTISSLGGIGGTTFTPIINAPEVAILGICRSTMRPVWDGKQFVPRLMLPLSLSYDHRVIDGAAAARFNAYLAEVLADMRRVML